MAYPMGEAKPAPLRVDFDRRPKLEFHGGDMSSDAGCSLVAAWNRLLIPHPFRIVEGECITSIKRVWAKRIAIYRLARYTLPERRLGNFGRAK